MSSTSGPQAAPSNAPPAGIVALGVVVLLVMFAVLAARLTGYEPETPALSTVVAERLLDFRDLPDGGVEVLDGQTQERIGRFAAGEGSFLRGVMRSLVRQRRSQDVALDGHFQLRRYSDGRLLIRDPDTNEFIDLIAFGPDNTAVFVAFLPSATGTPP